MAPTAGEAGRARLTGGHIHQLSTIQHLDGLGAVEIALPGGDDNGGDAIADQIAERAPSR